MADIPIPDDVKAKFPDLVEGILKSVFMDEEEKKYWISTLPIMTEDQLDELRGILSDEQKELAKAKEKEEKEGASLNPAELEKKILARKAERAAEESKIQSKEEEEAENMLKELESI